MNTEDASLIGLGLYSIPEASAYTGIRKAAIRRWLLGYKDRNARFHEALWVSPLANEEFEAITFGDLLELRFVQVFRAHGVSLQAIRLAAEHARYYFESDYPFTCQRFQTDGRSIFAAVKEETGDETLVDLIKRQNVFSQIVRPSLYSGIEYGERGAARRWYPMSRSKKVVLDPQVSFGRPVVTASNVPTEMLYQSWLGEDENASMVARLFEVGTDEVEAAVRFEQGIAQYNAVHH